MRAGQSRAGAAAAAEAVRAGKPGLVAKCNREYCASMAGRGGGVLDIELRVLPSSSASAGAVSAGSWQLVCHVLLDCMDAMGANLVNTVAELLAPDLLAVAVPENDGDTHRVGLRILSNHCPERVTTASFKLPAAALAYKGLDGAAVGRRIVEAAQFAVDDPFRAVTHNKGVMNGVDAVAVATGQDWRAIEAAAHAYCSLPTGRDEQDGGGGQYRPLTRYRWEEGAVGGGGGGGWLTGSIAIPMPVGTVGGALKSHPTYALVRPRPHTPARPTVRPTDRPTDRPPILRAPRHRFRSTLIGSAMITFTLSRMQVHKLLGNPDAAQLAIIIATVGLAQNMAAIRALAVRPSPRPPRLLPPPCFIRITFAMHTLTP